jgi:hypothetical protein
VIRQKEICTIHLVKLLTLRRRDVPVKFFGDMGGGTEQQLWRRIGRGASTRCLKVSRRSVSICAQGYKSEHTMDEGRISKDLDERLGRALAIHARTALARKRASS